MADVSFLDDVLGASTRKRDKCKVGRIVDSMPDDLAKLVTAALQHPDATHSAIASKLSDRGYEVSAHSVRLHRGGKCGCRD